MEYYDRDDLPQVEVGDVISKEQKLVFLLTWPTQLFWLLLYAAIAFAGYAIVGYRAANAEQDRAIHGNAGHSWYEQAELTPAAKTHFGIAECCHQAEVLGTKSRLTGQTWFYLDGNTWRPIPEFIIWRDKQPPDNMPVLFIWQGKLTCFFEPDPET